MTVRLEVYQIYPLARVQGVWEPFTGSGRGASKKVEGWKSRKVEKKQIGEKGK
jgi:hypothetical protein